MAVGDNVTVNYYDAEALIIALEKADCDMAFQVIAEKIRVDFETAKAA